MVTRLTMMMIATVMMAIVPLVSAVIPNGYLMTLVATDATKPYQVYPYAINPTTGVAKLLNNKPMDAVTKDVYDHPIRNTGTYNLVTKQVNYLALKHDAKWGTIDRTLYTINTTGDWIERICNYPIAGKVTPMGVRTDQTTGITYGISDDSTEIGAEQPSSIFQITYGINATASKILDVPPKVDESVFIMGNIALVPSNNVTNTSIGYVLTNRYYAPRTMWVGIFTLDYIKRVIVGELALNDRRLPIDYFNLCYDTVTQGLYSFQQDNNKDKPGVPTLYRIDVTPKTVTKTFIADFPVGTSPISDCYGGYFFTTAPQPAGAPLTVIVVDLTTKQVIQLSVPSVSNTAAPVSLTFVPQ